MEGNIDTHCTNCGRARDTYSGPLLPQFAGDRRRGGSASFGEVHHSSIASANFERSAGKADISSAQPTSEGASAKSQSSFNIRRNVTPEETSISLSKISKHAHGPSERASFSEEPIDQTQNPTKPNKSAITADENPIREDTYEQWIAADFLRDDSGDTRLSDDVEPKCVHEPSSDPESDLDGVLGPLTEPRAGDRSSADPDTSEELERSLIEDLCSHLSYTCYSYEFVVSSKESSSRIPCPEEGVFGGDA